MIYCVLAKFCAEQIGPRILENIYHGMQALRKTTKILSLIVNNLAAYVPTVLKFGMLECCELVQTDKF